ncbi:hypothetical protein Btru_048320, partial [Bulinus truncatus]
VEMLINFALETLNTTVISDKVSVDGHECTNLISQNWEIRKKGYLAEHFLRPPVNITFFFPCNVCIHKVDLLPCVGQQKSNLLELSSASQFQKARNVPNPEANNFRAACLPHNHSNFASARPSTSCLPNFSPVSKVFSNGERICFYNPEVVNLTSDQDCSAKQIIMKHCKREVLTASSHLSIRILSTMSGSAAALSKIDIWGIPSNSLPSLVKESIFSKYVNVHHQKTEISTCSENEKCESKADISQSSLEIPEEFLDSLTWEIMSVPILLPSGKNIDRSTLEKYISNESSSCRKPRDPFTGIEFSDTIKPLPNGALKTRIDQFLMQHSSHKVIGNIPRTVNSGVRPVLGKRKFSQQLSNLNSLSSMSLLYHNKHIPDKLQPTNLKEFQTINKILPNTSLQANTEHTNIRSKTSSSIAGTSNSISETSHEAQLKESLNSAIFSILHTQTSSENEQHCDTEEILCCHCAQILSNESIKYYLPCSHIVCRNCLSVSQSSTFECNTCHLHIAKHLIVRKYSVS